MLTLVLEFDFKINTVKTHKLHSQNFSTIVRFKIFHYRGVFHYIFCSPLLRGFTVVKKYGSTPS